MSTPVSVEVSSKPTLFCSNYPHFDIKKPASADDAVESSSVDDCSKKIGHINDRLDGKKYLSKSQAGINNQLSATHDATTLLSGVVVRCQGTTTVRRRHWPAEVNGGESLSSAAHDTGHEFGKRRKEQ